jgi:anaerobic magnesium-protoporphyrin IX monomethyl ester cyclase
MKVLLVYPPVNRLTHVRVNFFPLGLGYLAAITNARGHATRIYNAEFEKEDWPSLSTRERINNHSLFAEVLSNDAHGVWQEFRRVLEAEKPDIVGFSCTSASIMPCLKMAREVKKTGNTIVVFGGMHPTILPEETAKENGVDYIITGNAEISFPAFVDAVAWKQNPVLIKGVGRYENGKLYISDSPDDPDDLDIYPFPDREALVNFEEHKPFLGAIIASRGCPYKCTYCSGKNLTSRKVRYRKVPEIVKEIRLLHEKYNMNYITFYDDAFVVNKEKVKELCREIMAQNLKINWAAFVRVDSVNEEMLDLMRQSGCTELGLGVESGSDRVLKLANKGYNRAQALTGVKLIKKMGIRPLINIMIGFPYEKETDVEDTINLIKELGVLTNINTVTPYPNTELYDECVELGLIGSNLDWSRVSQHSPYNAFVHEMTKDQYRVLLDRMVTLVDDINARQNSAIQRYLDHAGRLFIDNGRNPCRFACDVSARLLNQCFGIHRKH